MKIKIRPEEIKSLAPMSATISRLTNLMHDINAKNSDITRLIELDSVLTANVLRWANSAYYGARVPIESMKAAVVRLGMNNIVRLSIGECLAGSMKKSVPGYHLGENELWRHNVAAALTVENLGPKLGEPVHPGAFTAALIHDIGKVVLGQHLDQETFDKLQQLIARDKLPSIAAERYLLETDHAEVGAAMAGYWKFPEELAHAIERHHDPEPEPDNLLDILLIANAVAKKVCAPGGMLPKDGFQETMIWQRHGLMAADITGVCEEVKTRLARAEEEWQAL